MGKPVKVASTHIQRQEPRSVAALPAGDSAEHEIDLAFVLRVAQRQRWWILACVLAGLAASIYLTRRTIPVYQSSASIRIDLKQSNLPTVFRDLDDNGGIATETVVLDSRTLAAQVVVPLGLQVNVTAPRGVVRSEVLTGITATGRAAPRDFLLQRKAGDRFALVDAVTQETVREVAPGETIQLDSVAFAVLPEAARNSEISISIIPFEAAISRVVGNLAAYQLSRDASIVVIGFEDPDRDLVWRVPNAIVDGYIAYRNEIHQSEARHTVHFLKEQLDSIQAQLGTAEDALRKYRQKYLVISPGAEASSQVGQLAQLQAQRRDVETERQVISKLLSEADAKAARAKPEDPSPYRELLAFPTLMRSGAASDLLGSLSRTDEERAQLLTRRTSNDPDVQAATERVQNLQRQIRGVVASYLDGLSRQLTELETSQAQFSRQLSRIPSTELGLARLERQPKVLQEIYTLLQTRLKEAEIAEASEDPSVRRVDPAIWPYRPVRPRPISNLFGGASLGLLLGVAVALLREARDKSVRSRADVLHATGMPVLGLIPQIPSRGSRGATLGEWKPVTARPEAPGPAPRLGRRNYTFLPNVAAEFGTLDPGSSQDAGPSNGDRSQVFSVPDAHRPALEAYSALQTNLEFATTAQGIRVLLLTSPLAGEGKTTCSGNLALALAERGRRVLLLDLDLRQGKIHGFFDAPRRPGLAEVLTGALTFAEVRRHVELGPGRRVDYVTTGTPPAAPLALLESPQLKALLEGLRESYDTILVDSPPVNFVTDALILSAHVDGVIIVARSGRTEGPDLTFAMEQLLRVGAPVLGVALNDIDFRGDSAYDRVYRYFVDSQYVNGPAEG